jgi:hypothetical protein
MNPALLVLCSLFAIAIAGPAFINPIKQPQLVVQVARQSDLQTLKRFLEKEKDVLDGGVINVDIEEMLPLNSYTELVSKLDGNSFSDSLEQLSRYVQVNIESSFATDGVDVDMTETHSSLQAKLLQLPFVTAAYVKPAPSVAMWIDPLTSSEFEPEDTKTPLFVEEQLHLNGPGGFNVSAVSSLKGGKGEGVKVLDVEFGWTFDHEDLIESEGKIVVGNPSRRGPYSEHGTAVIGVIAGNENEFGITGIAPKVKIMGASVENSPYPNVAKIIIEATKHVTKGDVMVIELHAPGPKCNFKSCGGQMGFIAMEFWPDNFHALKAAVELGIIVTEAAGNGNQDFDNEIYHTKPIGFPEDWVSPFDRSKADSGCILVGAGAPPKGTHGKDNGAELSRLSFSNYGSAVDVQGWGYEVATTGYGDMFRGQKALYVGDYTRQFSGTSSATPCVAGSIAALQGAAKAGSLGKERILTPREVRDMLRTTGPKQQDEPGRPATEHIGNRVNLYELVEAVKKL